MDSNFGHLLGTVKRDAKAGRSGSTSVLDFAVEVVNERGKLDIFDCRLTDQSEAYAELDGFVSEGEEIEVIGHLEKRTVTDGVRVAGVWVDVRSTQTCIYVDNVVTED